MMCISQLTFLEMGDGESVTQGQNVIQMQHSS